MTVDNQSQPDNTNDSSAAARAEYQEYYAVRDALDVNVIPMAADASVPSEDQFLQHVPAVFKLASELQVVDPSAMAQLRSLGNAAQAIADVLNQQNRKLTALIGYLLRNEDDPAHRTQAFEYGGAGVGFISQNPLLEGQLVELKLFLTDESAAVYSIAEVIECTPETTADDASESAPSYRAKALFRRISDNDRELIIRACMHAQTRLLKKRANERQETP